MRKTLFILALTAPSLLSLAAVEAQAAPDLPPVKPVVTNSYVPTDKVERDMEKPSGFAYGVTLAANLNVASNRDVVGQVNGNSLLFGASILARASYLKDRHEWLNTGAINEAWARTPSIDDYVKANDLVELQSLYNYFLRDWTGPFVRLALQTSLLKADRVTASSVTYVNEADATETETGTVFRQSGAGQPFTLNESAGWFFQPVRSDVFNTYGRVGLGGRHTWAEGARAIKDDKDPLMTTYAVLKDVHQAGAELFLGVDGKEYGGRLLYNAGLSALFPLLNNDDTDRSIIELTKVALTAAAGMGVFSWLSVNYQLKVLRDPQLVDEIQIQNALLVSLQYAKSSPNPSAKKTDAELAKERIALLEAQVTEAEHRAALAEARAASGANGAAQPVEPPAQPEPVNPAPPSELPTQPEPVNPAPPSEPPTQPLYPAPAPN